MKLTMTAFVFVLITSAAWGFRGEAVEPHWLLYKDKPVCGFIRQACLEAWVRRGLKETREWYALAECPDGVWHASGDYVYPPCSEEAKRYDEKIGTELDECVVILDNQFCVR